MNPQILFSWGGKIGRKTYLGWGCSLFAVKFILDRWVAHTFFNLKWGILHYLHITPSDHFTPALSRYYLVLLAMSLPFIWAGVSLTLRRLRDAALPLWTVAIFFIPLVNLLFFGILSLLPSRPEDETLLAENAARSPFDSVFVSALAAAAATALLTIGAVGLSVSAWRSYGLALFIAVPFVQGMLATLLHAVPRRREWRSSMTASLLALMLTAVGLMAFAMEGMVCLIMASPLALALGWLGAAVGHAIQLNRWNREARPLLYLFLVAALPALMGAEKLGGPRPPVFPVTTVIDIEVPPETVWRNVVSFSELPAPTEWIFKTGLAYPLRAEIDGRGPGALRRCVFSTGEFLEPIQVWDEPRLLRFSVLEQPVPMVEANPFGKVHPPHLEDSFRSRQGQFLLTALPNGGTRLEGTTWYEHGLWPAFYWKFWSDAVVHRIHRRVLTHIKRLSEEGGKGT